MNDRPTTLDRLQQAGFAVDALNDEQREVLNALGPQELAVPLDLKDRLDEVGPEVRAHSEIAGGALF